jgi:predicted small secreted protein
MVFFVVVQLILDVVMLSAVATLWGVGKDLGHLASRRSGL